MQWLSEYGLFLAKTLTVFISIIFCGLSLIGAIARARAFAREGQIRLMDLNERYRDLSDALREASYSPKQYKQYLKTEKLRLKREEALADDKPRTYVVSFDGDVRASELDGLREVISAIIPVAHERDEVLLCVESPGGSVHAYGLAASQLLRLKDVKLRLVVAVDKVAASGGYMMACTADTIIAAPFAVVGSIGAVMEVPNVYRLLNKHGVDVEQVTAGEYKRTLSVLAENSAKGRTKAREEVEEVHQLFKDFVLHQRPSLEMAVVGTGAFWHGSQALALGLVDRLETSDAYIQRAIQEGRRVLQVAYEPERGLKERLLRVGARMWTLLRG